MVVPVILIILGIALGVLVLFAAIVTLKAFTSSQSSGSIALNRRQAPLSFGSQTSTGATLFDDSQYLSQSVLSSGDANQVIVGQTTDSTVCDCPSVPDVATDNSSVCDCSSSSPDTSCDTSSSDPGSDCCSNSSSGDN
jgi:hypothetical protein